MWKIKCGNYNFVLLLCIVFVALAEDISATETNNGDHLENNSLTADVTADIKPDVTADRTADVTADKTTDIRVDVTDNTADKKADITADKEAYSEEVGVELQSQPAFDCNEKVCVRKCCKNDFAFDSFKCVEISSTNYTNVTSWEPENESLIDPSEFAIHTGMPPNMNENISCFVHLQKEFNLQRDGKIFLEDRKEEFSHQYYCVEKSLDDEGSVIGVICYNPTKKSSLDLIADKFHKAGLVISCVALILILLLYLVSQQWEDLHGKCMISFCLSQLISFILLIINLTEVVKLLETSSCVALAISIQFSVLSFYFWLNVMCYEILRIIKNTVSRVDSKKVVGTNRRFLYYSVYSWGCPLIICFVTCVMQYLPKDTPSYIIRPNIAHGRCWFEENSGAPIAYFYCIEIFLHIMNAIFMGHAVFLLYRNKVACLCCKGIAMDTPHTSNNSQGTMIWRQLIIFILFIFIWALNSVTLINSKHRFWRIIDVIVTLQGLFLLIILVSSKKDSLVIKSYNRICNIAKGRSFTVQNSSKQNPDTEFSTFYKTEECIL